MNSKTVEPEVNVASNQGVLERSGEVTSSDPLVSFLYELMRDHLTPGVVEGLVRTSINHGETSYSNGWLAEHAKDVAIRLQRGQSKSMLQVKELGFCPYCLKHIGINEGSSLKPESGREIHDCPYCSGRYYFIPKKED